MFDSHCHPQFPQYDSNREEVLKRTIDAGCGIICIGTDFEDSKKAIALAEKDNLIWASVGCHPNEVTGDISEYEELLKKTKVIAIGEVGLDYYRTPEKEKQEKQKEILVKFLDLGVKLNKPFIFHVRDSLRQTKGEASAHEDILSLIKNYKITGVIHSFTSNWPTAQKYINLGFYLGFNGIITFSDQYDEVVKNTPLDMILIETDAPYLAPVPHRGKRNEPLWVEFVARRIAEIKNISFEEVVSQTTKNVEFLFKIKGLIL